MKLKFLKINQDYNPRYKYDICLVYRNNLIQINIDVVNKAS